MLKFVPMKRLITLGMFVFCVVGCSLFNHPTSENFSPRSDAVEALIIQASPLLQGGKLLIVPFNPGEEVAATSECDKASLMIVKGIAQVLQPSSSSPFTVLVANNATEADLILKGRVVKMEHRSVFKKWMTKTKYHVLAVEGKLIDRVTGQEILSLHHVKEG